MAIEFPTYNGVEVASLPPDGYVVDFDNRKQQKWLDHILIFGLMAPLALIALIQRFYAKIFLSKGLQIDDFFMSLGWLTSVLTQVLMLSTAYLPNTLDIFGLLMFMPYAASISKRLFCSHSFEMPLSEYESYALYSYVTAPIYMMANGFTKLSLLTFYLRLSSGTWFRRAVWAGITIVSLASLIIVCFMYFGCNPLHKAFRLKTEGRCVNAGIFYMATAVSNIITDAILFVIPIPMVYGLRMPRIQKVGAMVVFSIGSVTIATSVVRLALLPIVLQSKDPSWDGCPADVWTFIEANLFIICGSTPTLRKFFRHFMPRLMGSAGQDDHRWGDGMPRPMGFPSDQSDYTYGDSSVPSNSLQSGSDLMSRLRRMSKPYIQFLPNNEDNEMQVPDSKGKHESEGGVMETTIDHPRVQPNDHSNQGEISQTRSETVQHD